MDRIPASHVALLMDELAMMQSLATKLNRELSAVQQAADTLKLFIQANCSHEWQPVKGAEHEGPICKHCRLMQMHQRIVEVAAEAKTEALLSCGDQANKCSTD